jgi:hypothetical protein
MSDIFGDLKAAQDDFSQDFYAMLGITESEVQIFTTDDQFLQLVTGVPANTEGANEAIERWAKANNRPVEGLKWVWSINNLGKDDAVCFDSLGGI